MTYFLLVVDFFMARANKIDNLDGIIVLFVFGFRC